MIWNGKYYDLLRSYSMWSLISTVVSVSSWLHKFNCPACVHEIYNKQVGVSIRRDSEMATHIATPSCLTEFLISLWDHRTSYGERISFSLGLIRFHWCESYCGHSSPCASLPVQLYRGSRESLHELKPHMPIAHQRTIAPAALKCRPPLTRLIAINNSHMLPMMGYVWWWCGCSVKLSLNGVCETIL